MVRTIFTWLLVAVLLGLIVLWLLGGGINKIIGNGSFFSLQSLLSSSSTLASFQLPFSPSGIPQMIPTVPDESGSGAGGATGTPLNGANSPYADEVILSQAAAITQTPSGQYVIISSEPDAPAINIAGWSLQSPLSGLRAILPEGASPFVMGTVNDVGADTLEPGGTAYVLTGDSPIGVSFSENECTGYLGTLQPFVPALAQTCPAPSSEIPDTSGNVARLGANCISYVDSLPPCEFPSNPPAGLSAACVQEIQTKLSYNGCVEEHRDSAGFSSNTWRIYLAQGAPLWNAQHDVVRLLDGDGRVVSVLNY